VVPASTVNIKVELVMVKLVGGDDDGMADNLSSVFSRLRPAGSGSV
jgi:hypothetical protein